MDIRGPSLLFWLPLFLRQASVPDLAERRKISALLSATVTHVMLPAMSDQLTKLKPKWRWLQFSSRTMLAAVTVLCVCLSTWIVPAERKRRTVAAIEAIGGHVTYVRPKQAASEPSTDGDGLHSVGNFLRRWLPRPYLYEID